MELKDLELLVEKVTTATSEKIDKSITDKFAEVLKGLVKNEEFEANESILKELQKNLEDIDLKGIIKQDALDTLKSDIQTQIDEFGTMMKKFNQEDTTIPKSLYERFKSVVMGDKFQAYLKGETKNLPRLDLKDILVDGSLTGAVVTPTRITQEVAFVPPKVFDIRSVLSTGSSDSDVIDHVVENVLTDNIGFLTEVAASALSDATFTQATFTSKRIGTHIDVSKKSLRNLSFLISFLSLRFGGLMAEAITDSVINGDGTGNAFDGLINNATTFTAGTLANSVDDANTADTIAAALCRYNEGTNMMANIIFMNPKDVYGMTVTKATTNEYVENPVIVSRGAAGQVFINGIPVVQTYHIAADTYLLGTNDASSVQYLTTAVVTMEASEEHDTNWIEAKVTFRIEEEAILPILKDFAWLTGTISTDKAAITV